MGPASQNDAFDDSVARMNGREWRKQHQVDFLKVKSVRLKLLRRNTFIFLDLGYCIDPVEFQLSLI